MNKIKRAGIILFFAVLLTLPMKADASESISSVEGEDSTAGTQLPVECKITYNANGGSSVAGAMLEKDAVYGKLPDTKRKGYIFKGWYTEKSGGTKITASDKVTGAITLYAQWEKVTVKKVRISSLKKNGSFGATLKIARDSGIKGYQIVYAENKSFKGAKKLTTSKATVSLNNLKKGRIYYVKVKAYKTDSTGSMVYGAYSTAKKVTLAAKKSSFITNKKFIGTYGYKGRKGTLASGWYHLIVNKITSDGVVRFQLDMGGPNGNYLYATNTLTARIDKDKATFTYDNDGWFNKGKGTLYFNKNGTIHVKIKETYTSKWNRSSLARPKTVFKKVSNKHKINKL